MGGIGKRRKGGESLPQKKHARVISSSGFSSLLAALQKGVLQRNDVHAQKPTTNGHGLCLPLAS